MEEWLSLLVLCAFGFLILVVWPLWLIGRFAVRLIPRAARDVWLGQTLAFGTLGVWRWIFGPQRVRIDRRPRGRRGRRGPRGR